MPPPKRWFATLNKTPNTMAEIKIAGIMRAGAFSPNHIGNDAAIFNLVADQLRKRGCVVNMYSEEQLAAGQVSERIIVDMCREQRSIQILQQKEDEGCLVVNSGYGIENCTRERMTRILIGRGIPYPESLIVDTDEAIKDRLVAGGFTLCWIKRGDFHTMHKEDVTFARHPQEAQELLQEYFMRGIKRAVINKHLSGDLIKFYGVKGTDFFYWFYPFTDGPNRRSQVGVADDTDHLPLDEAALKAICVKAADEMDIEIYGGDCIVGADGSIKMIDFNDWPSFAPCREEAALHIARHILAMIKSYLAS